MINFVVLLATALCYTTIDEEEGNVVVELPVAIEQVQTHQLNK